MSAPSPRPLIVVGGGEHGRVVIDAALSRPDLWHVRGYADIAPNAETDERFGAQGVVWLGDDATCARSHEDAVFVLGVGTVGDPTFRARVVASYVERSFVAVVHRDATVSETARLEPGVVVMAQAVVNTGARVRAHAIVNTGAVVEHDVVVGELAHIGPRAALGGGAIVGDGAAVGLGACVRDHVEVGARAIVAMGAVVVASVAAGATVMGNPARPRV